MKSFRLGGLIAAPYTPFDRAGDLHLAVIERYAAHLVSQGVKGAFICGTTGEGLSMTTQERMDTAQRWVDVSKSGGAAGLKTVIHVGHNSQRDAIDLARHAQKIGASATAALNPFFFKPASVAAMVDFAKPIAAAAPELPFYFYHIPSMTGVNAAMADFLDLAADKIPNLRGIKFTHGDLMDYQRCQAAHNGRFEIAWGVDEMLLGAIAAGAESAVGSTYNYAAPIYHKLIAAFREGDLDTARANSRLACEMVAVLLKHGVLRTGKATMSFINLDCGPVRAPITPLSADDVATIKAAYERIGFFDAIKNGKPHTLNGALAAAAH